MKPTENQAAECGILKEIVVLSDLHLVSPEKHNRGLDSVGRLRRAIASINLHHAKADLCILAGDLSDDLDYQTLLEETQHLSIPVCPMLGNHDDRARFRAIFADCPTDPEGFVQYAKDIQGLGRVVVLDTHESGRHEGHLCERRLRWLDDILSQADAQQSSVLVFMHHPPMKIGQRVDRSRLADPDPFRAILERHDCVRHLFAGHTHLPCSGVWYNIPFAIFGPVHLTVDMHEPEDGGKRSFYGAPAYYTVIRVSEESVTVLPYDFSDSNAPLAHQLFDN